MNFGHLRLGALTGLGVALLSTTAYAQINLRMAHGYPTDHPYHSANETMAEHVASCTDDAVQIDIYPGNQLGNEGAMNEQIRVGGVDLIQTSHPWAANSYPPIGVNSLPYLFRDRQHAISFQNSDVLRDLREGFNEETGLQMLSSAYMGSFNISTRGVRIDSLADLEGVRLRAPDIEVFMAFPPALGAVAVPIPFAELYLALQQGVAQGSFNPITNTYSLSLYEVQDYIALTEHMMDFQAVIASSQAWDRLDDAQRDCLREGAEIFAEEAAMGILALEEDLEERMVAEGLVEITRPDKDEFIQATEELRAYLMDRYGYSEDLVSRIQAIE